MAKKHHFLALDLGAESGRGILVTLDSAAVSMEEIHRWPTRRVSLAGTLYWDLPFLFSEILQSLRICSERGVKLTSVGVDTWGVDFGLLDGRGKLLGLPVAYRDARTENIHEYSGAVMSKADIFQATAGETWVIASLFQLLAMQRDGDPLLKTADTFLNLPNLFIYLLTGKKVNERSIVSSATLMGPDKQWSRDILTKFKLPPIFGELVDPGTRVGPLRDDVAQEVGLPGLPVVATCGHDTAAVVASVPAEGDNWAFLSCGTWSILGTLVERPVLNPRCPELGYCNEFTYGGWYLCNHILGLWLAQELRRKWDTPSDPWDYPRMTAEAGTNESADYDGLVDVTDSTLLAPDDMEVALLKVLARCDQPEPKTRGRLVRLVLESLALEYALQLRTLNDLSGGRKDAMYMVGGGIHNQLLCQFTADACGVPVHAGADQCTALGNALVQAAAMEILHGPEEVRQVMRRSTKIAIYTPRDQKVWEAKRNRYAAIRGR